MDGASRPEPCGSQQAFLSPTTEPRGHWKPHALSDLPSDIVGLVVGFVPLLPRVRHVSLVSKRWRKAVLESVKELADCWPRTAIAAALPLLPSLQSVCINAHTDPDWSLPPTLTSLYVSSSGCCCHKIGQLSTLVNLQAPIVSNACTTCLATLLENNRYTLTSLDLSGVTDGVHLPHLNALTLRFYDEFRFPGNFAACASLLRTHCTLLRVLSMRLGPFSASAIVDQLLSVAFPALTSLTLQLSEYIEDQGRVVSAFVAAAPALQDITLSAPSGSLHYTAIALAAPRLTGVYSNLDLSTGEPIDCPMLTRLDTPCGAPRLRRSAPPQHLSVVLSALSRSWHASLRSLVVHTPWKYREPFAVPTGVPHFPNVRKCEFRFFRPKAAAAALKAVSDVVALCPLLREVAYHVYTETEALVAHESELLQVLRAADAQGVESWTFTFNAVQCEPFDAPFIARLAKQMTCMLVGQSRLLRFTDRLINFDA